MLLYVAISPMKPRAMSMYMMTASDMNCVESEPPIELLNMK